MIERPILFSGPMVRALLDGSKTQTRRAVKGLTIAADGVKPNDGGSQGFRVFTAGEAVQQIRCPYGVLGDSLWVKETWRPSAAREDWDVDVRYQADGAFRTIKDGEFGERDWLMPKAAATGHVSPLFMPRWASRLTLGITAVRVERLHDISEADATAEGATPCANGAWFDRSPALAGSDARGAYYLLWESINGKGSWADNPWVWVVSFEVRT